MRPLINEFNINCEPVERIKNIPIFRKNFISLHLLLSLFKEKRQLIFLKPYTISNMIYDYLYSINYIALSRNALFSKNSQRSY